MKSNVQINDQSQQYTSESVLKLISENDFFTKKIEGLDTKFDSLDSKFKKIQDFNLECLVTKKFFNCLSCGSKKINYLPLNQFVRGDDGRSYKANPQSRDPRIFSNNSNVHTSTISNPHFNEKHSKPSVFNVEFGNRRAKENGKRAFNTGKDVFTREEAQAQHHLKRHVPLEQIREEDRYKPKIFKSSQKKKRPQTAVLKIK